MAAYLHCASIYKVSNCEFCASAETILGYNVQNRGAASNHYQSLRKNLLIPK